MSKESIADRYDRPLEGTGIYEALAAQDAERGRGVVDEVQPANMAQVVTLYVKYREGEEDPSKRDFGEGTMVIAADQPNHI